MHPPEVTCISRMIVKTAIRRMTIPLTFFSEQLTQVDTLAQELSQHQPHQKDLQ